MRRAATGVGSLLVLLLLLVGVPLGLHAVAGNPLAHLPGLRDLTRPDDGSLFLLVLVLLGWAGWATFAVSTVVEGLAALRGRPAPRLPALGLQQRSAGALIAGIALLFSLGGPALTASAAGVTPTAAIVTVSSPANLTTLSQQVAPPAAAPVHQQHEAAARGPLHQVAPGETLWSIAEQYLGDGAQYRQIAQLNYDRAQPDGTTLDNSHWIQPGWTLQLPAYARDQARPAAETTHTHVVEAGETLAGIAQQELGNSGQWQAISDASRDVIQPGGRHLTDPDVIGIGWTLNVPAQPGAAAHTPATQPPSGEAPAASPPATKAPAAQSPAAPATQAPATQAPATQAPATQAPATQAPATQAPAVDPVDDADGQFPVRTAAGVGSLLAAGVLTLLATRRGAQQRRRKPGQRLPLPTGEAADVELELRATADPLSVDAVDLALRGLARHCIEAGQSLPAVRAGRLTAEQFDLYLSEPAHLPAPWTGGAGDTLWTLHADDVDHGQSLADVPAPYPSLITLGHDEEQGHVLLNLEHVGALAVTGSPDDTRQILAAIAIELATSRWADDLRITVVGAYPELEDALQSGRIRYLPAIGRVVDELTARAAGDQQALAAHGSPDLAHARTHGVAEDAWVPEIVLLAGEVSDSARDELAQLVESLPRVAIAAVTGRQPLGEWRIEVDHDQAVLQPVGLPLQPQRIDDRTYQQLLTVLGVTDDDGDEHVDVAPEPALSDLPAATDSSIDGRGLTWNPSPKDPQSSPYAGSIRLSASTTTIDLTALEQGQHTATTPAAVATAPVDVVGASDEPHPGSPNALDEAGSDAAPDLLADSAVPVDEQVDAVVGHDSDAPLKSKAVVKADASAETELPDAGHGGEDAEQDYTPYDLAALSHLLPRRSARSDTPEHTQPARAAEPVPATPQTAAQLEQQTDSTTAKTSDRAVADQPSPRLLVLGPVELLHPAGTLSEPRRARRLTELAAFMLLHPGSETKTIRDGYFAGAAKRPSEPATRQAISRLRAWLGGAEYLPTNPAGGRYMMPGVTSDWQDWQELISGPAGAASTNALEQALALVRARPFGGVIDPRTYAWAEYQALTMTNAITDAAGELAHRRLMEGRYRAALDAAAVGLLVDPSLERLWRHRIRAARGIGDQTLLRDAVDRMLAVAPEDLEPETLTLLEELSGAPQEPPQKAAAR